MIHTTLDNHDRGSVARGMDIKLGKMVALSVDEEGYLDPTADYELKARVIAIDLTNRSRYVVGWKDGQELPQERMATYPGDGQFVQVSNFHAYDYYLSSWAKDFFADDLRRDKDIMAKALGNVKQDAVEAAWRQGVEKVIESGHKHLVARATATMGSARGKLVASFLESSTGKHVLAYGLGVALEAAVPHIDDERLERLAKELRVYGLEVVMGFFVTEVQGFLKDALKHLPKKTPALPAT